jgi:hypothetical protein
MQLLDKFLTHCIYESWAPACRKEWSRRRRMNSYVVNRLLPKRVGRRKIRRIETNAKCRHLKKFYL